MIRADVEAFSAALAPAIARLALWNDQAHTTASEHLTEVLAVDDVQAFLRLRDGSSGQIGPIIQFLTTGHFPYDGFEVLPDGRHVPVVMQETLDSGRLAYTWFPDEQTPEIRERFTALAELAFRHVRAVTHPHVARRLDGSHWRNCRIGSHAKQWLREDPPEVSATTASC
ncbi:hypothetical protein [Actinomadura gamaensis]|uniref:Aminoglycoside phosphotransferase domain-containing protein n=1 Tax=Actinomadura gamaensis TaxID=1763541 RepID=A0ABV9TUQ3_9ACTN